MISTLRNGHSLSSLGLLAGGTESVYSVVGLGLGFSVAVITFKAPQASHSSSGNTVFTFYLVGGLGC